MTNLDRSQTQAKLERFIRKFAAEVSFEVAQTLAENQLEEWVHEDVCETIERVTLSFINRVKTSAETIVSTTDEYPATRPGGPLYALLHMVDHSLERMKHDSVA